MLIRGTFSEVCYYPKKTRRHVLFVPFCVPSCASCVPFPTSEHQLQRELNHAVITRRDASDLAGDAALVRGGRTEKSRVQVEVCGKDCTWFELFRPRALQQLDI